MRARKLLQVALAASASVVVGYLVISRLSLADLRGVLQGFDWRLLLLSFLAYQLANVVRGRRFSTLVGGQISTFDFLRIVFVQNFMNTFLPLRAGEASYLYLVHRTGNVAPGQNVSSLLVARMLDFLFALLLPLVVSPWSRGWSAPGNVVAWLLALVMVSALVLLLLGLKARQVADFVERRWAPERPLLKRSVALGVESLRACAELRGRRVLGRVAMLTLCCWLLIYASGYCLLLGAGVSVSLADCVFAYGFPVLVSMTPLFMLGGFGVYEGSVGVGLSLVGVPTSLALATGLLLHIAELSFIVVSFLFTPLFGLRRSAARPAI